MKKLHWLFALALVSFVAGCGVWDSITGSDDDAVYLKGDTGQSCTYDSECKSNNCIFPGVCQ